MKNFCFSKDSVKRKKRLEFPRGAAGPAVPWECWVAGLIPGPAHWVKDPTLPIL